MNPPLVYQLKMRAWNSPIIMPVGSASGSSPGDGHGHVLFVAQPRFQFLNHHQPGLDVARELHDVRAVLSCSAAT